MILLYKNIVETDSVISGMTVKNPQLPEEGNMALHVCHDPNNIIANRQQLSTELGVTLDQFVCANQTHSSTFYKAEKADAGKGAYDVADAIADVDALYTFERGLVLTAFSADCVPIIFYNDDLVGAIHSGWKGTVQSITEKVFTHLRDVEAVDLSSVHVHIGSCLSQANFEVDADVATQFQALGYADAFIEYDAARRKYLINNQAVVRAQCMRAGIVLEKVTTDLTCTMDATEGFSYREERTTGRHMTFIMRK